MKNLLVFIFSLSLSFCQAQDITINTKFKDAVPVLNFGTFHMGDTPDATKTEFDEYNKENVRQIHKIAKMLAEFKPTVIIVEQLPAFQEELEKNYLAYLADSSIKFEKPNEIELLAYEIGRLSETKRIYGVDYKEGYKYNIFFSLKNKVDSLTYLRYGRMMDKNEEDYLKSLGHEPTLLEMLKMNNHPDYLDFLLNINADMLTYASTQGKSEGADEAAKFYHRNLVMFSNINQIKLSKDDRVFILMGATHTAFFKELMKRSPRYNLVNVFDYLK